MAKYKSPVVDFLNEVVLRKLNVRVTGARPIAWAFRNQVRAFYLHDCCDLAKDVPGAVVECGVGIGESLIALVASHCVLGVERKFYGFDAFAGFVGTDPSKGDRGNDGHVAMPLEDVRHYFRSSGIPSSEMERVSFVPGDVRETAKGFHESIALLHLDLDIYWPYKLALESLYPLVAPGGLVLFDEYGHKGFRGATPAITEYLGDQVSLIQHHAPSGKHFMVKPSSRP